MSIESLSSSYLPDPRIRAVAEALVEYDQTAETKTWRDLAIVAVSTIDRWHALHDPRPMGDLGDPLGGDGEYANPFLEADTP
jgi:hypothetical protein